MYRDFDQEEKTTFRALQAKDILKLSWRREDMFEDKQYDVLCIKIICQTRLSMEFSPLNKMCKSLSIVFVQENIL